MLCLVARCEERAIRVPVPSGQVRLGSSAASDVVVPFPGISGVHALLAPTAAGLLVTDLGSKNGLVFEGRRVPEALLAPGVSLRLGRASLTIEEASTSDVELGLWLDAARGRPPSPWPQTDTDSDERASPSGSPAAALRLVRDIEKAGERAFARDRAAHLSRAREVLEADALLVFECSDSGEFAVLLSDGPLPPESFLDALAGLARSGPRGSSSKSDVIEGRAVLAWVPKGRGGSTCFVGAFPAGGGAIPQWKRDLFDFIGERFLPARPAKAPPPAGPAPEAAPAESLHLPEGMVIGSSPAMAKLLSQLRATVQSQLDVLILGETGTGKEYFARMIHGTGPTAPGPFVAINCAAIPSELLEAELFGVHGRVATGVDPRVGLIVQAEGGSIFLDEIGELAEPLQAKLLRFLQEREVMAIGASAPKRVNVRVLSSSNRNLLRDVEAGRFRKDLYYRLRGLQFHLPPLGERREDIPALVLAFVERAAAEDRKVIRGVSRGALNLLARHSWPGNIRELEFEVKRAVLLCPSGGAVQKEHFGPIRWMVEHGTPLEPAGLAVPPDAAPAESAAPPDGAAPFRPLQERIDAVERSAIDEALRRSGGNKSAAARLLGITRNGLAMKLARLRKKT